MATTTDNKELEKQAVALAKLLGPLTAMPKDTLMSYLAAVAAAGAAVGTGIGAASSYMKSKNPKLVALDRKKKFYDSKVDEMANENWLNDVLDTRKKLESSKLSDEERTALEDKYIRLLDAQK